MMRIDGIEVPVDPSEWEFLGYRKAGPGEYWWDGARMSFAGSIATSHPYFIFRKVEALHIGLKPGWIAMNPRGEWFWFEKRPIFTGSSPALIEVPGSGCKLLDKELFDLPSCQDWQTSLRRVG